MPMDDAFTRFRDLHERKKRRMLAANEMPDYERAREELARVVLQVQRLSLQPGQTARQSMRVAHANKVRVSTTTRVFDSMTLDLSETGFAALLDGPLSVGTVTDAELAIKGSAPVRASARVVACMRHGGAALFRVSFAITRISPEERERLSDAIVDAALARLAG